ncbi:hypothetical protein BJY14_007604 [Actinomadura luteofluorescens]|uniref:Amidohydrolase-related domain-containing protein n=1 Tax=Actinomadura luteofluorescens TaxID=46163 RepID=A0A7Y9JKB0_9ACTN|nr:amidohydrolase family protein [Actinomadura luteofluorescens]NYD51621.1 hypothetical protein [Actinomadura luteofluorescens]
MSTDSLVMVDHHCHGLIRTDLGREEFEQLATEATTPPAPGTSHFDSPVGLAIRAHCAPVLGLPPHAAPGGYLARRNELGCAEVARRLLAAAGIDTFLLDCGFRAADLLTPAEMERIGDVSTREITRLEAVLESTAWEGAAHLADGFGATLAAECAESRSVGLKSIIAYRHGLDFDPARPGRREVLAAADAWLRAGGRVEDPVLLRHALWCGVDLGLPLQFHVGYGDPDIVLYRNDPTLMTEFIRAVSVPIMLLHCYPYHREAGYLAAVYPHVHFDVGLAVSFTGPSAERVIAESMELAPYTKVLFSSDAFGLPELYLLGSLLFRRGLAATLARWQDDGHVDAADVARITSLVCGGNALRVYGLDVHG